MKKMKKNQPNKLPYGFRFREIQRLEMGSVLDIEKEQREVREFESADTEGFIDREDLIKLAKEGIALCEDGCISRSYSGEKCKCIRERFHSESIYELYKKSREFFLQNLATGILGELSEGKNDDNGL